MSWTKAFAVSYGLGTVFFKVGLRPVSTLIRTLLRQLGKDNIKKLSGIREEAGYTWTKIELSNNILEKHNS